MRHLLSQLDYDSKDLELVGVPDPLLVGRASQLFEDDEQPIRQFPAAVTPPSQHALAHWVLHDAGRKDPSAAVDSLGRMAAVSA